MNNKEFRFSDVPQQNQQSIPLTKGETICTILVAVNFILGGGGGNIVKRF